MDMDTDFYDSLNDLYLDLGCGWPDMSQYEIDQIIYKMKDMVNEEYKKGTLNYYYRPPKEDTEKEAE
ncbi:MAG: hypothetical protein GX362_02410 [Methanosarcinaceae archaeon]|nr:hypothetical protein [Methanosarcinaceae archaeon]